MRTLLAITFMLCVSAAAEELKMEELVPKEFDRYRFVILKRGAKTIPEGESQKVLLRHLAHLRDLHRAGDLVTYGPFEAAPSEPLRGIAVFRGDLPLERVREMLDKDPFVQAGAMTYEVLTWMTAKGQLQTRQAVP